MVFDGLKDGFSLGVAILSRDDMPSLPLVCVQFLSDLFICMPRSINSPVGCIEIHFFRLWT